MSNIIPITYAGGTGARFLNYFVTAAKCNIQETASLSNFGSAHRNLYQEMRIPPWGDLLLDDYSKLDSTDLRGRSTSEHINWIIKNEPINRYTYPIFVSAHLHDLDLTLMTFQKVIRIIFDSDDIGDISKVWLGKWIMEETYKTTDLEKIYNRRVDMLTEFLPNYQMKTELKDRVLFVSWKDMVSNSPSNLVTKLSEFTNIPHDNFNISNLELWRSRTKFCINEVNQLIDPKSVDNNLST